MNGFFGAAPSQAPWGSPWQLIAVAWGVWTLSWMAAALWSRRTTARPAVTEEFLYRVITALGITLLFGFWNPLPRSGWTVSINLAWAMFVLVVAGMIFTWWARLHLGALWSSTVTRKEDHRIVDTGPYALVRHPMYAAATAMLGGIPLALGSWWGLLPLILISPVLIWRLLDEERMLMLDLPGYPDYVQTVRYRLIPGLW